MPMQCGNKATVQSGKGRHQAQLKCVHIKGRNRREILTASFREKIFVQL